MGWSKQQVENELKEMEPAFEQARLKSSAVIHLSSLPIANGIISNEINKCHDEFYWQYEKQTQLKTRLYQINQEQNSELQVKLANKQLKSCKDTMITLEYCIVHIWCKDIIKIANIGQQ